MGDCSGKSTVGKLVASALKYPFLDSDTLIEQLAGCTISDIFRDEGEESFREVESQVLQVGLRFSASALILRTAHTRTPIASHRAPSDTANSEG